MTRHIDKAQMARLNEVCNEEAAIFKEIRQTAHLLSKDEWHALKQKSDEASAKVKAYMTEIGWGS